VSHNKSEVLYVFLALSFLCADVIRWDDLVDWFKLWHYGLYRTFGNSTALFDC